MADERQTNKFFYHANIRLKKSNGCFWYVEVFSIRFDSIELMTRIRCSEMLWIRFILIIILISLKWIVSANSGGRTSLIPRANLEELYLASIPRHFKQSDYSAIIFQWKVSISIAYLLLRRCYVIQSSREEFALDGENMTGRTRAIVLRNDNVGECNRYIYLRIIRQSPDCFLDTPGMTHFRDVLQTIYY